MDTYLDLAGEALSVGNACYRGGDGKLYKAQASAASTMPAIALAADSIETDAEGEFFARGHVELTSHGLGDPGDILYISEDTAGLLNSVMPSSVGEQVQIVGQIVNSNTIDFSPNLMLLEVA